jgi:hypothetical protein
MVAHLGAGATLIGRRCSPPRSPLESDENLGVDP